MLEAKAYRECTREVGHHTSKFFHKVEDGKRKKKSIVYSDNR